MQEVLGVPGAGSVPAFMHAAFPFLHRSLDHRSAGLDDHIAAIHSAHPTVLVGISIGAHLCVEAAIQMPGIRGLILVAPAWLDTPDPRHAELARSVALTGIETHLRVLPATPAWLREAITHAWRTYDADSLIGHLAEVSERPGPGVARLRAIEVPTVVIGFWDDPVHPWSVAQAWAQHIRRRRLIGLPLQALERGVDLLGRLGRANLPGLLASGNLDRGGR